MPRGSLSDAPIACHEISLSGEIVWVNEAECRLLGLDENQIVGRQVWDFVAPESQETSRAAVRAKLAGTVALQVFEREYARPDGARLVLEIHEVHIRDEAGGIAGMRSFLLDITEQRRAAHALRDSEKRYRHLVEHASDIIYQADLQGRFRVFNPTASRLLGYNPEELAGRKYLELICPDYRRQAHHFYREQLARRTAHTYFEFPALAKDGRELWFGQNVELIEEGGRPVGFEAIARDITPQRKAEERQRLAREELELRVQQRTAQLQLAHDLLLRGIEERQQAEQQRRRLEEQVQHAQRLESLGVLAGGIAHDFNNLLAAIMGYAALALQELPSRSRTHTHIEEVLSAAKNAAELTQQMLAYSGRGRFRLQPIDLSRLIGEVTRLLGSVISKKANLRLDLEPLLPAVNADPAQLRQVLINLITNASDALGEQPGSIEVTTGALSAAVQQIAALDPEHFLPPGRYVFIEVRDTGCGMDAATRARMFDPFFTTKFTGRGLGLAAVLGIVRGHGGTLDVESEPGRGTRFRVVFPVTEQTAREEEAAPSPHVPWHSSGTILVVDDEPYVRDLAREVLGRAGLTVLTADDGNAAVACYAEHHDEIRAVILDLTMPGMDGAEVFEHITGIRPDAQIILCSGYNMAELTSRFGERGPAAFLRKPYMPAELMQAVRAVWKG
jgi:two-component system, cell cycle sensor histidine kinase and response regulator CckA